MNSYTINLHNNFTYKDIMIQALEDSYAVNVSGDGYSAVILYGCKISVDHETNDVTIQTTSMGGEWYKDISQEMHQIFLEKGWRIGVYELSLSNYRTKLDKVELSIKAEMNGRRNPKQIQSLKASRENILMRYSKIKNKLNQISNETKNSKHQR